MESRGGGKGHTVEKQLFYYLKATPLPPAPWGVEAWRLGSLDLWTLEAWRLGGLEA